MSKELKIKHAIIITIVLIVIVSCGLCAYFLQSENQDLKNDQSSIIQVTTTKTAETICPITTEETTTTEEDATTTTPIKQYQKLAGLFTEYTVEYPLGWHVIDSGLEYFEQDEINTIYVHFNNNPITQVPRGGQPGVIALIDQSGTIPTLEKFLAEKKADFQNLTEETITISSDLAAYKLSGQTLQYEEWLENVIYILEYTDSVGDRHLVYSSLQTNFEDTTTSDADLLVLDHIVKSFKVNQE